MTRHTDLHDVLNGLLVPSEEKVAGPDISNLSLFELGELMGIKTAGVEKVAVSPGWIERGVVSGAAQRMAKAGVPLHPEVAQGLGAGIRAGLPATESAISRVVTRMGGSAGDVARETRAGRRAMVRSGTVAFPKNMSASQAATVNQEGLKNLRALGGPAGVARHVEAGAAKLSEDVEYTGQVNNGEPSNPTWPRAALGVDSAGRKATPEEKREQEKVVTPDVQHVEPHSDGGQFVIKGAHDEKLLGLFTKKAVSEEWLSKRLGDAAAKRVLGPIDRIFKGDAIRREVKDRLVGSRDTTRALKGMGVLKTTQPEAVFKRHDAWEVIKDIRERSKKSSYAEERREQEKEAKKTPEERQAKYIAKLDKYIAKKGMTPERAKEILSKPPSRFKAIYGFGAQERQRDAAHRVLSQHKTSSLAAVGAVLRRPF